MGKRNSERIFRKVQSKALRKGVLITSAVLLMIGGPFWLGSIPHPACAM